VVEPVTVVIATRNRNASVARTIASLLEGTERPHDIVVVDQSDDDRTAAAVEPFAEDVRYLRSRTTGLARAHNVAIAEARTELIAVTDDDCEVSRDWLAAIPGAFACDPRIALVFGGVLPMPHDPAMGFVPGYVREEAFLARSLADKARIDGMGACMALRRRIWMELGGFDERFGAGGPFHAADEGEFALRALEAGWFVYETPAVSVLHRGLRGRMEAHALVHRYAYGTGAMMAKHVRARTPYTKRLLGTMAWRWARGRTHSAVRIGGGRHRLLRLDGFVRGFVAGALAGSP
jgi:GT2 family glycosyltransferase